MTAAGSARSASTQQLMEPTLLCPSRIRPIMLIADTDHDCFYFHIHVESSWRARANALVESDNNK